MLHFRNTNVSDHRELSWGHFADFVKDGLNFWSDLSVEESNNDVQSLLSFTFPSKVFLVVWDDVENTLEDLDTMTEVLISNSNTSVFWVSFVGNIETSLSELTDDIDSSKSWLLPSHVKLDKLFFLSWFLGSLLALWDLTRFG